jgi:NTP pyrophosphatase (non-canonical NTP hydrolase)
MTFEELNKLVIEWANERGLIAGTTPEKQIKKLREEFRELRLAISKNDFIETIDGIGDMLVVIINLCEKLGLDPVYCLTCAYFEIKDRKGQMINGTFVKEE